MVWLILFFFVREMTSPSPPCISGQHPFFARWAVAGRTRRVSFVLSFGRLRWLPGVNFDVDDDAKQLKRLVDFVQPTLKYPKLGTHCKYIGKTAAFAAFSDVQWTNWTCHAWYLIHCASLHILGFLPRAAPGEPSLLTLSVVPRSHRHQVICRDLSPPQDKGHPFDVL